MLEALVFQSRSTPDMVSILPLSYVVKSHYFLEPQNTENEL